MMTFLASILLILFSTFWVMVASALAPSIVNPEIVGDEKRSVELTWWVCVFLAVVCALIAGAIL